MLSVICTTGLDTDNEGDRTAFSESRVPPCTSDQRLLANSKIEGSGLSRLSWSRGRNGSYGG